MKLNEFAKKISYDNAKKYIKAHWYLFVLLIIVISAYWVRAIPARFNELPGLDEFYFYRLSEYALTHNLQLPNPDLMRHHPFGMDPYASEFLGTVYTSVLLYLLITSLGIGINFFTFALLYPPIMGAIASIAMFFLAKEFYDYKAGLFSSFFLAVIPAFINRTSAGIIEKEATLAPFMILTLFFFIKSLRTKNPVYGILSGIFMAILGLTSSIVLYYYIIIAVFAVILLVMNKHSKNLLMSYTPTIIIGLTLPLISEHNISLSTINLAPVSFSILVLILVVIRYGAERFNLVKKEYLLYLTPALILFGFVGFLVSTMFLDQSVLILNHAIELITLKQTNPVAYTVAENQPGDWNSMVQSSSPGLAGNIIPQLSFLSPYISIWIFMVIGIILIAYKLIRRREVFLIFPLIWLASGIWSVFFQIRFLFLFGPPAVFVAGYFLAWFVNRVLAFKNSSNEKIKKISKQLPFYLIIIVGLIVTVNLSNAYAYTNGMGPSICFPNPQFLINGQKCLELDENNNIVKYADGQPWYQAFIFMSTQTPENSNFLSWWDFGYWFQTRGKRPSVSDGGYGPRKPIADWFTADVSRWSEFEPWLKDTYDVQYIFMDYTLPGKYGAITAIHSDSQKIKNIWQFQQTNQYPEANRTIIEFSSGPYAIWIPFGQDGILGAPILLQQTQGGGYARLGYINDICANSGITRIGNEQQDIGGCVAVTNLGGLFYLDSEVENTVFARLMFMDGIGLPVEKVFDNTFIKIYKVNYEDLTSNVTG